MHVVFREKSVGNKGTLCDRCCYRLLQGKPCFRRERMCYAQNASLYLGVGRHGHAGSCAAMTAHIIQT